MEINLLVLSLGNSRLGIGTFFAGELGPVIHIPHGQRGDWGRRIAEQWERIAERDLPAVVAASVNPALDEPLQEAVAQATGRRTLWIGKDIDLPIKIATEQPEQTGVDRVLNIAAAYEQMGKACVVVDAGTAITIDCCNDAGEFLGGAISPGVSMMLDALNERTAKLPRVDFEVPVGPFGQSTKQAILQGVYHGVRGMVKELVEQYATELGQWPDIIATGGDTEKLFGGWELIHAISPDLAMYGIALAYANHHIRHGT
jgi:type III pantothenate kinase